MKSDDFEARLARIPRRELPESWRAQILDSAPGESARPKLAPVLRRESDRLPGIAAWFSWHWAWSGLAAVWFVILGLNGLTRAFLASAPHSEVTLDRLPLVSLSINTRTRGIERGAKTPDQEARTAQRLLLTELLEDVSPPVSRTGPATLRPLGPRGALVQPGLGGKGEGTAPATYTA